MITLEWDSGDLKVWRSHSVDKALARALKKAGGSAVKALKAASTRSVRFRRQLKVRFVNDSLPLLYPRSGKLEDLVWTMLVSGRPVPLVQYPHRVTKKGLFVSVKRGSSRLVHGAFEARMDSGHVGIFKRVGKDRLPIKELFSTRVSDVFQDGGMIPAVQAQAQRVFKSTFDRVLALELQKK